MSQDKQYDAIEYFHGAKIQSGPMNDRIYLMKLGSADPKVLLSALEQLALEKQFGKIFAKGPAANGQCFIDADYQLEASVPGFYNGTEDGWFLSKYFNAQRALAENIDQLDAVLQLAKDRQQTAKSVGLDEKFQFQRVYPEHAEMICEVYREVFASYPFPIHDPDYIRQTMADDVFYFSIWHQGEIIAMSSAELDRDGGNVEMTDFATLPQWRGYSFAVFLLQQMEMEMRKMKIPTAYTIARAVSPGMNITFAKMGYQYSGRLINNTQISGKLESMNLWHKSLC
ncbi:MAG: putative beta-lysine N-acetyltransferase [Phycisphaerae bacterium]|nr:putative beta-lysine N-acetyltransferase [Phycisphaerae bacterium]